MLVIRDDQRVALRQHRLASFAERMTSHLMDFAPRHAETIGRERMGAVVQRGIRDAEAAGFDTVGPVRLYLELMCLFGSYFGTDPQLPWAGEILRAGFTDDQAARADALHRRSGRFLSEVFGPGNIHGRAALMALSDWARQPRPLPDSGFEAAASSGVAAIWPQRYACAGDGALRALAARARAEADARGLATDRGRTLVFILMLGFGHGFADDPLFPWFSEDGLRDRVADPAERLEARMQAYLAVMMRRAGR